jgi:hypothetical protein
MLFEGFDGEIIQSAGKRIALDLTVEPSRLELRKPDAEARKLVRRKLLDRLFDIIDTAHAMPSSRARYAHNPRYAFLTSGLSISSDALPCISTRPVCRM